MQKRTTFLRISVKARDLLKELSKIKEMPMSSVMKILIEQEYEKTKEE